MNHLFNKAVSLLAGKTTRRHFNYSLILLLPLATLVMPLFLAGSDNGISDVALAASDPVIAAAGDIACDPASTSFNNGNGSSTNCRQKYTSNLLVNAGLAAVLDLGDNQYYCGGYQAFVQSYALSWGRVKSITHPSVGNHEYLTSGGTGCTISNEGASGYFDYFGSAAGPRGKGYYSFDIGKWHLIALNSNCTDVGGCGSTSPQWKWLQADLAAHKNACTLAYWHIPLFSSGGRAASNTQPFWQLLYDNDVDVILNGHDHIYERFAAQNPNGTSDPLRGMREFIVGTGGSDHTSILQIVPNSQVRNTSTYGVIKLTLHSASYNWQFVPEAGMSFTDSGKGICHGNSSDTIPPSPPTNLAATSVAWNQVKLSWTASTDNIGVLGYQIFRNGTKIGTVAGTSYVDKGVQGQNNFNYYVVAVDGGGLSSQPSNILNVITPTVTPTRTLVSTQTKAPTQTRTPTRTGISATLTSTGAQSGFLTFTSLADSYIRSDQPASNFGTATQLFADNSPTMDMLIKFKVSGVGTQGVSSARLRLYCVNGSAFGGEFHRAATSSWSEGTVTWDTAPAANATVLGTLGAVAVGNWYEVDVTSMISGDGTFSLRVNSTSPDGAIYSSREGAAGFAPQLVITTGAARLAANLESMPMGTPEITNIPTTTSTLAETITSTVTPTPTFTQMSTTPMSAQPSTQPGTLTFTPIADTYIQSDQPANNFGANTQIVADNSPLRIMLLKFDVSGVGSQGIVSVKLRLYCVNGSPFGGEFHHVADNTWNEESVTWNTAPSADTVGLVTLGAVEAGHWYEVDVTSLVTGDGTFSLGVNSSSTDGAYYSSKEDTAGFAPQLVILTSP